MFWKKKGEPVRAGEAPATPQSERDTLHHWIDGFMVNVCGYKDVDERTDEHGRRHFNKGSASGMAWTSIDGEDGNEQCSFHCAAYVMDLPSDVDLLLPLYRELLEINWQLTGVPRVAVLKNGVWTLYSEYASLLTSPVQVAVAIDAVMRLADSLDDHLISQYGGSSASTSA